jgi:hypothetical protein
MQAYRHAEGGQRLEELTDEADDPRAELAILSKAVTLYDQALEFSNTAAVVNRAIKLAQSLGIDPKTVNRLQSTTERAHAYLKQPPQPNSEGPTPLDVYLPRTMSQAVDGDLEAGKEAAHLICDIRLGLLLAGGDRWKRLTDGTLLTQPGKKQAEALGVIGKILHDKLLCSLTETLSGWGITQLVLVPDMFTRFVPLHLSLICGKEIQVAGVDTEGARYLCEVMPVEYAPCLQAVIASQIYKRPKTVSTVAAFVDPVGDLPTLRQVLGGLSELVRNPAHHSMPAATGQAHRPGRGGQCTARTNY